MMEGARTYPEADGIGEGSHAPGPLWVEGLPDPQKWATICLLCGQVPVLARSGEQSDNG